MPVLHKRQIVFFSLGLYIYRVSLFELDLFRAGESKNYELFPSGGSTGS
jgi:hypothetical protein